MENARLRLGRLEYFKAPANSKSAPTQIALWMDRAIIQPPTETEGGAICHLMSVFGGEQEISAIGAAISEEGRFRVSGPGLPVQTVSLRDKAMVFRGSITLPGRKHPVKHLVALSDELAQTEGGRNHGASQTVVYDGDPQFMLYRLGVRFGIPTLPEWSGWIVNELRRRNLFNPLLGIGCSPVIVRADKKMLLGLISNGLKARHLTIPDGTSVIRWNVRRSIAA